MTSVDPTRLLMLDSGAFSVWTQGVSIDLNEYIAFCRAHPGCSYYVNLDVIPGRPGNKKTLTRESVEASCQTGWDNYKRMVAELPQHKVIHVFHQNDDIRWLEKYLEAGVPYIGISPANDRQTAGRQSRAVLPGRSQPNTTKLQWLRSIKRLLFDGAGRPTCRTHGFAVTSYDLMQEMEWWSVDSASWKLAGAWGNIYIPAKRRGQWVFDEPPSLVCISAVSSDCGLRNTDRLHEAQVKEWLAEIGIPLGAFDVKTVAAGYKLAKSDEIWFSKKKRQVMVITSPGVMTSTEHRLRCNAEVVKRANTVLPVRNIYFAGAVMPYPLEHELGRRLLSYHSLAGKSIKSLEKHEDLVKAHRRAR